MIYLYTISALALFTLLQAWRGSFPKWEKWACSVLAIFIVSVSLGFTCRPEPPPETPSIDGLVPITTTPVQK